MKISMLMATLNRKDLMLKAIDSILKQSYQDFEIIVIDQSDIENAEIVQIDKRIKYIHLTQKGLSHARNIGLRYVEGEIVGLMDDDAFYTEDVLKKINTLFEQDSNLGLVSGAVVDHTTNRISLRGMNGKRKAITRKNIFKCCISPSMFIKKEIFDSEIFDEQLGLGNFWGSAEETDIALKILYAGYNAIFCPEVIVYHPSCNKSDLPFAKLESYSRGFGAVCAKHKYKFGNKTMGYLYFWALFRALGGYVLNILKMSSHMRSYYKISIRAKREGYKTYLEKTGEEFDS